MPGISDAIERFILTLLGDEDTAELQRNELALRFGCAPSQINYVLSTRFTQEKGFVIQSRRGGGGYVRVVRVQLRLPGEENLMEWIGGSLEEASALGLMDMLKREGLLTPREALLIKSMLADEVLRVGASDELRASMVKNVLAAMLTYGRSEI